MSNSMYKLFDALDEISGGYWALDEMRRDYRFNSIPINPEHVRQKIEQIRNATNEAEALFADIIAKQEEQDHGTNPKR